MAQTQYYAGTYRDCDGRVLKVTDDVDHQSCDMESSPGLIVAAGLCKVSTMINWGFELAGQLWYIKVYRISKGKGRE